MACCSVGHTVCLYAFETNNHDLVYVTIESNIHTTKTVAPKLDKLPLNFNGGSADFVERPKYTILTTILIFNNAV